MGSICINDGPGCLYSFERDCCFVFKNTKQRKQRSKQTSKSKTKTTNKTKQTRLKIDLAFDNF